MSFSQIISMLCSKEDLGKDEATEFMESLMKKELTDVQAGAALIALQSKGVTAEELSAFVGTLRGFAVKIHPKAGNLIDTCGTGGDKSHTFNISTATAIVLAACGVHVAKHGNRSVSSKSGSADVLERLGVNVTLAPECVERCIDEIGIGFLFAPTHHPAFRNVAHIRKELGTRTVFNMLGPLLNPAGAKAQLIGVFEPGLTELFAETLKRAGTESAMIVHGEDGMDEVTLCAKTKVTQLKDGTIKTLYITPEDAGLKRCRKEELMSKDADESARILTEILESKKSARRDIVLLNAAAGL
ncbi:anthranilate phosphoribosyltransferase, partial [Candidatus Woesearchaeota archaeon CG_4_10_14_0_8_um_filter_47_5]